MSLSYFCFKHWWVAVVVHLINVKLADSLPLCTADCNGAVLMRITVPSTSSHVTTKGLTSLKDSKGKRLHVCWVEWLSIHPLCECANIRLFADPLLVSAAMHECSKRLHDCLAEMYDPEWFGKEEVDSIAEVCKHVTGRT